MKEVLLLDSAGPLWAEPFLHVLGEFQNLGTNGILDPSKKKKREFKPQTQRVKPYVFDLIWKNNSLFPWLRSLSSP